MKFIPDVINIPSNLKGCQQAFLEYFNVRRNPCSTIQKCLLKWCKQTNCADNYLKKSNWNVYLKYWSRFCTDEKFISLILMSINNHFKRGLSSMVNCGLIFQKWCRFPTLPNIAFNAKSLFQCYKCLQIMSGLTFFFIPITLCKYWSKRKER